MGFWDDTRTNYHNHKAGRINESTAAMLRARGWGTDLVDAALDGDIELALALAPIGRGIDFARSVALVARYDYELTGRSTGRQRDIGADAFADRLGRAAALLDALNADTQDT